VARTPPNGTPVNTDVDSDTHIDSDSAHGQNDDPWQRALAGVGARLRALREEHGTTLGELAGSTGISVSTLSRLERGQRRPTLELLLPIARAHQVPLDDLVGTPEVGDPRVRLVPRHVGGHVVLPLTRQPGGPQAFKMIIQPSDATPEQRTHEGYEWLYVLSGRVRLLLGDRDVELRSGEAAEFDTRLPHWFGAADNRPVEVLCLFGPQGERMHLRARPTRR
jgi:transcriptional regulator with XRE-family HTH domain